MPSGSARSSPLCLSSHLSPSLFSPLPLPPPYPPPPSAFLPSYHTAAVARVCHVAVSLTSVILQIPPRESGLADRTGFAAPRTRRPAQELVAAKWLIDAGVELIAQHSDHLIPQMVARNEGLVSIGTTRSACEPLTVYVRLVYFVGALLRTTYLLRGCIAPGRFRPSQDRPGGLRLV